ncbi:hypothetical protein GF361_04600 [Candidatus Woesearchaeota archaeon]|nr:hypothetical protein [Candidatus Woesearchaeota archaeon]
MTNKKDNFKENTLDEYHFLKKKCSDHVTKYVSQSLEEMVQDRSERSKYLVNAIHKKRDKSPRLREFIIEQAYVACTKKEIPEDLYKIGAAIEVYNLSTYLVNWFLDKKGELKDRADEQRAVIEGIRLYDKSKQMIRSTSIKESLKEKIIKELEIVNNQIYLGQGDDVDRLNLRNNTHNLSEKTYIENYKETCRRKCGYFLGFTARVGGYLAEADNNQIDSLSKFGIALGTGIQIVNDVADNILAKEASSVERPYQDQFSDIENGLITASIYSAIKKQPKIKDYLNKTLDSQEKLELYETLKRINAFDLPMHITRRLSENVAKKALKKTFNKNSRKYLSQMTAILCNSIIYNQLKYQGYKRKSLC